SRRSSIALMRRISACAFAVSTSTSGLATIADSLSSRFAALIMPRVNLESFRSTSGVAIRFDRSASCLSRPSSDAAIFANTPDALSTAFTTYWIDAISPLRGLLRGLLRLELAERQPLRQFRAGRLVQEPADGHAEVGGEAEDEDAPGASPKFSAASFAA